MLAWFKPAAAGAATILGLIVAANGYEESRLDTKRRAAEDSYYQLVTNLGSRDLVGRIGAIGQIHGVLISKVPKDEHPQLWEGLLYLIGTHEHDTEPLYHEVIRRAITILLHAPKQVSDVAPFEADALLEMLCNVGPEGWYLAEARPFVPEREECLRWIWENAPEQRLSDRSSFSLFSGSYLVGADLHRYDLLHANFSDATLIDVAFDESELEGAHFGGAQLERVSFKNSDLQEADFSGAVLVNVSFAGADLAGADFRGATLGAVTIEGARNLNRVIGLPVGGS